MSSGAIRRYYAALNLQRLDDAERQTLVSAIQTNSATSPLIKNTSVAATLATVVATCATLTANVLTAAALLKQAKAAVSLLESSRSSCDLELVALKALVESLAQSAADITGMGFTLLTVARNSQTVPAAPASVLIKIGTAHGKARAVVDGKGPQGTFMAQATFDPIGPASVWFALPGTGKQRKLAYPTGTKVWVQFAQVRYGLQGPWSTPVLVTMP